MGNPIFVAKRGSFEEFMSEYEPAMAVTYRSVGETLLFSSVANSDIDARVAITMRLLDDGADPSVVCGGINVLHVLFARRGHDPVREAPMLRRLIEGGADINLVSKREGPPLVGLMERGPRPESARVPFYDVFFGRPDLDLSVPSMTAGKTLREFILAHSGMPLLRERVAAFDAEHERT